MYSKILYIRNVLLIKDYPRLCLCDVVIYLFGLVKLYPHLPKFIKISLAVKTKQTDFYI